MNISTIADMITKDGSIKDDIPAFLARVNEKTIKQVRNVRYEVSREEYFISVAEQNGGPATEADVMAAIDSLDIKPLLQEAEDRYANVVQAISSGEASSVEAIVQKFAE